MKNTFEKYSSKKWTAIILIDLILLGMIIFYFGVIRPFHHPNVNINGIYLEHAKNIPPLNLIDHHGKPFTHTSLEGHWTVMFFGFTHCTMVCPLTLNALKKFDALLQKQLPPHLLPMIVFITIDPENDTISRLDKYLSSYNTNFIGLRADVNKTKSLEKQFSITVSGMNENIVHSTDILVLNPKAQIQAYLRFPPKPATMVNDYLEIIKH